MPVVISHIDSQSAIAGLNHKLYCEALSYDCITVSHVRDVPEMLEGTTRYGVIRSRLRLLPEGDWLLYLDGNAAIHRPMPVDDLLGSDDRLLVALLGSGPPEPAKGLMVWRNTAENRDLLLRLDIIKGHEFARASTGGDELDLLRRSGLLPVHERRNNRIVATRSRVLNWGRLDPFAVCFDKLESDLYSHHFSEYRPYRDFVIARINRMMVSGSMLFDSLSTESDVSDLYNSINEGRPIALISLYTPNIKSYATISELNVARYCVRHGLAYHVYRDIPSGAPPNVSGNWLKAWLLLKHIEDHEWVVWIDADMLFVDQSQSLAAKLAGRDIMVARDIAGWSFNSGFLAFKNTEVNRQVLRDISAMIDQVLDKTSVYVNQGDQFIFNRYFEDKGMINDQNVCDYFTANTHFCFTTKDTFLAHFMGLGEPTRSCMMADFEQISLAEDR